MLNSLDQQLAKWRAGRSKTRSYGLVVGLFLLLLVVSLATSWWAIELVNETRAYATGEGRYSKAQKMAVMDLYRYAYSRTPSDYAEFLQDVRIPLGDQAARLALIRNPPDTAAAARGFLQGNNHPRDIAGLIRLFRWFSWWQPFVAAQQDWRIADGEVNTLIAEGRSLHDAIAAGRLGDRERTRMLADIDRLDRQITDRENTFSTHMGEAARQATALVVWGLGFLTVLLWTIGTTFAARLFRQQLTLDRQLAQSERRFRDFTEVASDWYWEMDRDNNITYLSDRLYRITNVTEGAVIGADGTEMIRQSADDPAQRDESIDAIARRQPFRGVRLRFTAPDGSEGYGAVSGKPTFDTRGNFTGYRGIGSDITAQVRDAQVLVDAKIRAEGANRAKSDFLANMSHELRTPLNAILGFSDVIATRMFGEAALDRYADYARDIHSSGFHLLSIINDILDLSKVESGRAELDEGEAMLGNVVAEAVRLVGERLRPEGVAFDVSLPETEPRLRIDERKFVQILVNLLSNAFKFTPAGGVVSLEAGWLADGGLAIRVCDTGIGIAPNEIEKVLSPFGQVESAFSRNNHGTGLGLPLAKSLAELHGGSLSLASVENEGTVVTVTLPPARVVAAAPAQSASRSA